MVVGITFTIYNVEKRDMNHSRRMVAFKHVEVFWSVSVLLRYVNFGKWNL